MTQAFLPVSAALLLLALFVPFVTVVGAVLVPLVLRSPALNLRP
jgi:hypothetical protein